MATLKKLSKFQTVITQIKNKNYEMALELLSKIDTNLEEKNLENKLYGSIYFKKKEWLKSIECFNRVLKTNEKDLVVLNNIGVALFNLGRFNDAIIFFKKLSLHENNSINSLRSLGITYKNIGDYEKAIEYFVKILNIRSNDDSIKQNLIDIFNFYIPNETKNNYLIKLNKEILNLNQELKVTELINFKYVKNFINQYLVKLDNLNLEYKETQIFRRNEVNLNCDRHFTVFNEHKIIPKYCFNCYKIQIDLKNIIDLIKVFFIFNIFNFENNNIRKCIVETRRNVSGNYKAYIFCTGLEEAKKIIKLVSDEIKKTGIAARKIIIKHGCTEFYKEYPEYENINYNGEQKFQYLNEWQEKEDLIDKSVNKNNVNDEKIVGPTINQVTLSDILIIKNWMAYAKLIDDKSLSEIFSEEINSDYINELIKDQIIFRKNN